MNKEKIKRILQEYREVEDKVRIVAESYYWVLKSGDRCSYDYYYDSIENFKFDMDKEEVIFSVEYENSDGIQRDIYSFPLFLIFIEGEKELKKAIKEYIEEEGRKAKVAFEAQREEERRKVEEKKDKDDLEEYLRLKEKFKF